MSAPDNPLAFPKTKSAGCPPVQDGMTLRDYFAGQIAQGMAAHSGTMGGSFGPGEVAKRAYEVADAMLVGRAKS